MLIRSISGVRGLTATHLTPAVVRRYAQAIHQFLPKGAVILGRDTRPSGEALSRALAETLIALGRDVVDCGIVPTPTVQFVVERNAAAGGIIVTASHNPIEWNGLKFVRGDGTFFHPRECEQLFILVDTGEAPDNAVKPGTYLPDNSALQKHVTHIVNLKCIDLQTIRGRRFRVVIDAVNGAGATALPMLLETLGCEVVKVNCELTGDFVRGAEPLPENLATLCETVKAVSADVGFAVDPDADRLAVVSEKGIPLGEEYTLVLAVEGYLLTTGRQETFVTNLSSSMALDKLTERYGCTVERSAVGEINVVRKMLELNANLGGEGNGGVILREAHLGRDSLVGAALVLNRMALSKKSLSVIHAELPQFEIVKDRVGLKGIRVEKLLEQVRRLFDDAAVNNEDGLKFTWDDRWIHLRKSNTEPILRIYAEAPTGEQARQLIQKIKGLFQ
ncbi:MAG: phosphoglucosamine mutase [FCB group bacterium]|nr:phosphoglucosamine mutase [FCB group bacterium]